MPCFPGEVWERAGKRIPESSLRVLVTSQLTEESRIDRAENVLGLGCYSRSKDRASSFNSLWKMRYNWNAESILFLCFHEKTNEARALSKLMLQLMREGVSETEFS